MALEFDVVVGVFILHELDLLLRAPQGLVHVLALFDFDGDVQVAMEEQNPNLNLLRPLLGNPTFQIPADLGLEIRYLSPAWTSRSWKPTPTPLSAAWLLPGNQVRCSVRNPAIAILGSSNR